MSELRGHKDTPLEKSQRELIKALEGLLSCYRTGSAHGGRYVDRVSKARQNVYNLENPHDI